MFLTTEQLEELIKRPRLTLIKSDGLAPRGGYIKRRFRRLAIFVAIFAAGCGGGGGDIKAERDALAVEPDYEEVACLLEQTECPWTTTGTLYVTERVPHLLPPYASAGRLAGDKGCTFVAVGPYEALTAWHCVESRDASTIVLTPQYTLGESVHDTEKAVIDKRQVVADKALLTVADAFRYWTAECPDIGVAGEQVTVLGYPLNYDGNEVMQSLPTTLANSISLYGDWGGGGSGAPVYRHWDTEDQCVEGLMVEIASDTTQIIQQQLLR